MKRTVWFFICTLLGLFIGIPIGIFLAPNAAESQEHLVRVIEDHQDGKLTSPLLTCDTSRVVAGEYNSLEHFFKTFIEQRKASGTITEMAIYYRDLLDGSWFGINEKIVFSPASLLKIPVMMSLYKLEEKDPSLAKKEVEIKELGSLENVQYRPKERLEVGKSYTVDELIRRMIVYSDNDAMMALRSEFPPEVFTTIYKEFDMQVPDSAPSADFMTVKSYASFFRILYNASYLSIENSERALDLLTTIDYTDGINKGLPSEVPVAHKFGERLKEDTGEKQLHDCGIVYRSENPYLLCIMTRGTSYEYLADTIAEASKIIWKERDSRVKKP